MAKRKAISPSTKGNPSTSERENERPKIKRQKVTDSTAKDIPSSKANTGPKAPATKIANHALVKPEKETAKNVLRMLNQRSSA